MPKTHYKISGIDCRSQGQSEYEYTHQAACGYVRETVTENGDDVDCKWCLSSIHMINYHVLKNSRSYAVAENTVKKIIKLSYANDGNLAGPTTQWCANTIDR